MADILFLLAALVLVAVVMIPVVAEGIWHTRFVRRRALESARVSLALFVDGWVRAMAGAIVSIEALRAAMNSPIPPAPELSPDELLTVIEFGIHEGADS